MNLFTPGLLINNRYKLIKHIATGGMGQIWQAEDIKLERLVAIKILKTEFSNNETFLNRFQTEAKHTAKLNSENIAKIFDYDETTLISNHKIAFLIMELVLGKNLNELLAEKKHLTFSETLDILTGVAKGLAAAHEIGIVHRDIKPGNIMLTNWGNIKILDFGIAKTNNEIQNTTTDLVMGTAQYIPPEQALGKPCTPASDIYALGVVAYECLLGEKLFTADTALDIAVKHIHSKLPKLPDYLSGSEKTLLTKMLEKDPKLRYSNGTELLNFLTDLETQNSKLKFNLTPAHDLSNLKTETPLSNSQLPSNIATITVKNANPRENEKQNFSTLNIKHKWSKLQKILLGIIILLLLISGVCLGFLFSISNESHSKTTNLVNNIGALYAN